MSAIVRSPAKVTFSLRSVVFAAFAIIGVGVVWAFTSPAAPKPVGPQAAPVPTPPHSGGRPPAVVAVPAHPSGFKPQPAPVPVPTPPGFTAPTSTSLERSISDTAASLSVPAVKGLGWLLPVGLLMGLIVWLRHAASFQRNAFAR